MKEVKGILQIFFVKQLLMRSGGNEVTASGASPNFVLAMALADAGPKLL
jgi:hypothetical protein